MGGQDVPAEAGHDAGAGPAEAGHHGSLVGIALLCLALAIIHTWPLALAPGTYSRNDNGDAQLNEWILAWVEHTLPRDPLHLFHANIFYPAKDTLAFSEPLIVPAVLGAPIAWLGGSPVLVFNLMAIAGFALTAFAGFLLVLRWTGDRPAALLAGTTFAFNTHTLSRLAHLQGLHIYGLPLALLFTDRILMRGRARDGLWLAVWMVAMAYTSGYLLVFASIMVAVGALVRLREWLPRARPVLLSFAIAVVIAALAILPLWIPYHRAATEQGMVRSLESVAEFSATPRGYLAASGTLHISTWSGRFFKDPVDSFFPGFVLIVLACAAVVLAFARGPDGERALIRRRVLMLACIGIAGFILSLGPATPVYRWIYRIFPPMQGLRAAARFGNLFLLAMSVLAGIGLAQVRRRFGRPATASALAVAAIVLANGEALRAPLEYRRFTGVPRVYALLADEPHVVLAEVPFYPRQAVFENAEYVLNSTAHWQPLMNGYSGYTPASYVDYANVFWYFPRDYAIDAMKRAGVTHVMVHPERFGNEASDVLAALEKRTDFELVGVGPGGLRLYRLH
jgi:hypothetical protein